MDAAPQLLADHPPVFVGGSPRSGTHAMGRLVGSDPDYAWIRVEARIHCGRGGLTHLIQDKTSMAEFLDRCDGGWWQRGERGTQGLLEIIEREAFDELLLTLVKDWDANPIAAARDFVVGLFGGFALRTGASAWAEITGGNIREAPTLVQMFPEARFVHMIRDGRAVAASVLARPQMTDDPVEAINRWARRIRSANPAMTELPAENVLLVPLDALAAHDREATFGRLVAFLGISEPESIADAFARDITAEAANVDGWRQRVPQATARLLDEHYDELLQSFAAEGLDWIPQPLR